MKILTLNFLNCAVKTCRASSNNFPLHPKDAELVQDDIELNPQFLINILPRLEWAALRTTATEVPPGRDECFCASQLISVQLGFPTLPEQAPTAEELQDDEAMLKELHNLLVQTQINEGKLVCFNCGHEYGIREGIANFLLPSHLV